MRTYKLTLSYDGSAFYGFQRQSDAALPTVQGVLEGTYEELFKEKIAIHGAGRTDAGVHARAQVAHLTSAREIAPARMQYALNRALPPSLVVSDLQLAPAGFHARKSAIGKWYSYRIYNGQTPPAMGHQYFTHVPQPMDAALFAAALDKVVGAHNFEGFCGRGATVKTFEREIYLAALSTDGPWWQVDFVGNGFLRKMVRNLVGTAIDIALGRRRIECIDRALATRDRSEAGPTAAANGLVMEAVFYDEAALAACLDALGAKPRVAATP